MISLVYFLLASILSTLAILGAIALAKERPDYLRAFVAALVATFSSTFLLSYIPVNQLLLEVVLWVVLVKVLFRFSWKRTLIVGLVGYAIKFALDMVGVTGLILLLLGL